MNHLFSRLRRVASLCSGIADAQQLSPFTYHFYNKMGTFMSRLRLVDELGVPVLHAVGAAGTKEGAAGD